MPPSHVIARFTFALLGLPVVSTLMPRSELISSVPEMKSSRGDLLALSSSYQQCLQEYPLPRRDNFRHGL